MALVEQLPRARHQILDCCVHHEIDSRQAETLPGVGERLKPERSALTDPCGFCGR